MRTGASNDGFGLLQDFEYGVMFPSDAVQMVCKTFLLTSLVTLHHPA